MFKIEKDIPIHRKSRIRPYPTELLEVGDSYFVGFEEESAKKVRTRVSVHVSLQNKLNAGAKRFCCRTVDGGIRVWRTE